MIEIYKNEVKRDGQVVGYIEGEYIRDHAYEKVGYVEGNYIHDMTGNKVAYIEGEYLYPYADREGRVELDKINEAITGDAVSELTRCAVYQLIGA